MYRNKEIYSNLSSALIALGIMSVKEGEVYKIPYTNQFGEIDFLVALGTGDGVGPKYYTIISDKRLFIVSKIVSELPDVSQGVFGAVYLLMDPDGGVFRCHLSDTNADEGTVWEKEEISGDHMISCTEDAGLYFLRGGSLSGFSSSLSVQIVTDKNTYDIPVSSWPSVRKESYYTDYYNESGENTIGVWDEE